MLRVFIFVLILLVGWPTIWFFLKRAEKDECISFFGLNRTMKRDDPEKFNKVVRSYKMQMAALPFVAAFVAIFMEIPK